MADYSKQNEIVKQQWLDSEKTIEVEIFNGSAWINIKMPLFTFNREYRIKPGWIKTDSGWKFKPDNEVIGFPQEMVREDWASISDYKNESTIIIDKETGEPISEEKRRKSIDDAKPEEWDALHRVVKESLSPLDIQVGGSHYKDMKIQPAEFIDKNQLPFLEGCAIKRLCRHSKPSGKGLQDLEKAKHEIDLIIKMRYS